MVVAKKENINVNPKNEEKENRVKHVFNIKKNLKKELVKERIKDAHVVKNVNKKNIIL